MFITADETNSVGNTLLCLLFPGNNINQLFESMHAYNTKVLCYVRPINVKNPNLNILLGIEKVFHTRNF